MGAEEVMERTGRKKSAAYEAIAGRSRPTGIEAARYRDAAVQWVTEQDPELGPVERRHQFGVLYRYKSQLTPSSRGI